MLRHGNISEVDADKGLAKVVFNDDGLPSDWMSPVLLGTINDSISWEMSKGQQVACLMNENQVYGVILGAVYSKDVQPVNAGSNMFSVTFSNGDLIKYDKGTGKMQLKSFWRINH